VTVWREVSLAAQTSVRGDPQPGFPVEPNTFSLVGTHPVLWLGPDEWLVIGASEDDFPTAAAVVDVSANRACLEIRGSTAPGLLARGCALDLDAFEVGHCAQTLIARAEAILYRPDEDAFRILVRPSFAGYLGSWLTDAIRAG